MDRKEGLDINNNERSNNSENITVPKGKCKRLFKHQSQMTADFMLWVVLKNCFTLGDNVPKYIQKKIKMH